MAFTVTLDGTNLTTAGYYISDVQGWLDAPQRDAETLTVRGASRALYVAPTTVQPRRVVLVGYASPATRTAANRRAVEDTLKRFAQRSGALTLSVNDGGTTRVIDGVVTRVATKLIGHPIEGTVSQTELELLCADPRWRATSATTVNLSTTAASIALGTAPVGGVVTIQTSGGVNVVNPTIVYKNSAGTTLTTLTFTGTLASATSDKLLVDLDNLTVTRQVSGVTSNAASWLTSGDFFVCDPADGVPATPAWPSITLGRTSGTPTGTWVGTLQYA